MKKKRTFGVSPKGALILRAREEERRRNLPRVEATPHGALKRVERNPLLELMAEFPMLPVIDLDKVVDPEVSGGLDLSLLTVRGGGLGKLPWDKHITGRHYNTQPAADEDFLKKVTDHLIRPLKVFDPTWEGKVINMPNNGEDIHFTWDPNASFNDKFQIELVENDNQPTSNWLNSWYPGGVLVDPAERLAPNSNGLTYRMKLANARAEVGHDDNNYRDFFDTITSWYTRDAEPIEYRLYTREAKLCEHMEKLTKYFREFKERHGVRLSGLDIIIGFEEDNRYKLLVTEVFNNEHSMLLLEVVTTVRNMRPLGPVKFHKEPGSLRGRHAGEPDISWTFNTFFSDFNVFGRDQLSQFLDIVVYCLDKGVREDISYYG